jgi:hypothetical protein
LITSANTLFLLAILASILLYHVTTFSPFFPAILPAATSMNHLSSFLNGSVHRRAADTVLAITFAIGAG